MSDFLKKLKFKKGMLAFLLAAVPAAFILNGCKQEEPTETPPIIDIDYNKEDYYNRFPIQVYIDSKFSDYNKELMLTSLQELDEAIKGLTFEYHTKQGGISLNKYYSYIIIDFDKDGSSTLKSYENPNSNEKPYAHASLPFVYKDFYEYQGGQSHRIQNFVSDITMGSYFAIGEDIPSTNNLMSLEIRWNNNTKFGAYNNSFYFVFDNGYWNYNTTYNQFKLNVDTAFKGVLKHEVGHALGYKGNSNVGCNTGVNCHSSDENSLMQEYFSTQNSIAKNQVSNDVIEFFKQKYPSKQNVNLTSTPNVNAQVLFYHNRVQIALSSVDKELLTQAITNFTERLKQKHIKNVEQEL